MCATRADGVLDRLQLTPPKEADIERCLKERMRTDASELNGVKRRTEKRSPYRLRDALILCVDHGQGTKAKYLVAPRDISENGIGFLHGVAIHPGTRCTLALRAKDGSETTVWGRIASCRHVVGSVHNVGATFDEPIGVSRFTVIEKSDGACGPIVNDAASAARTNKRLQILVVDDDPIFQTLASKHLEKIGYRTLVAGNAREALAALAAAEPIGLMILDVVMPELDGLGLLQFIRRQPWGKDVPVILASATLNEGGLQRASQLGVADCLPKPISLKALRESVDRAMRKIPPPITDLEGTIKRLETDKSTLGDMLEVLANGVTELVEQTSGQSGPDELSLLGSKLAAMGGGAHNLGIERLGNALHALGESLRQRDRAESDSYARWVRRELSLLRAVMQDLDPGVLPDAVGNEDDTVL